MTHPRRVSTSSLALAAGFLAGGCTFDVGSEEEIPGDEPTIAKLTKPIIDGQQISPEHSAVVALESAAGFQCSASLIRNYALLTAAHCLEGFHPYQLWARMGSQVSRIITWFVNPTPSTDTAVVYLMDPMKLSWSGLHKPYGFGIPIFGGTLNELVGQSVRCAGYGLGSTEPPDIYGILRQATLVAQPHGSNHVLFPKNASGQVGAYGDSGGPCFTTQTAFPTVVSAQSVCFGHFDPSSCYSDAPHRFRDFVNNTLAAPAAYKGVLPQPAFAWDIIDPPSAVQGPSQWVMTGAMPGGVYRTMHQLSNVYAGSTSTSSPSKPGTLAVAQNQFVNNGWVTAQISSPTDDDAGGFVFRYVDKDNYYRVSMDEQRHYVRLVKKQDGVYTTLGQHTSANVDMSAVNYLAVRAQDGNFQVWHNGVHKFTVTDNGIVMPFGRVGFYSWGLENARFDQMWLQPL